MNRLARTVLILISLSFAGNANAVVISYSYEFDTPTFSDPLFGDFTSRLALAGPTITGTLSFDTDDANPLSTVDNYNIFSHTSELMSVAGLSAPTGLYVTKGGVTPVNLFFFNHPTDSRIHLDLFFPASTFGAELSARCVDASGTSCGGPTVVSEDATLTNFSLVRADSVPEPTTIALMGLGLAGIGYQRRRSKKAA